MSRSSLLDDVVRAMQWWSSEPGLRSRLLYHVLRSATPFELMQLEVDYRARRYSLPDVTRPITPAEPTYPDADRRLRPYCLAALAPEPEVGEPGSHDGEAGRYLLAAAAMMTFDRSGYVRESGVVELAEDPGPFALPFLLLRFNDPVEKVRLAAQKAAAAGLTPHRADVIVGMLPLVDGVRSRRRAGGLLTVVDEVLDQAGPAALWRGARSDDGPVRAACLRRLLRTEPAATIETAFATRDPALRAWAAQMATSSRLTPEQKEAALPLLENSTSPRIRLRAARARARQLNSTPHLHRALLDPDARVRYLARAALYARGFTDLAPQVYRDALDSDPVPDSTAIGALGGLADLGSPIRDLPRVEGFLTHPKARVRAEAWRTLSILAPPEVERRAAQLAADPSRRVQRAVAGFDDSARQAPHKQ